MPAVIDLACHCGNDRLFSFYPDGSVKRYVCLGHLLSGGRYSPSYEIGEAYTKPGWWAHRVVMAADRLTDCIAEFGEQVINGKCLCGACGERVEDLDGALGALKAVVEDKV